MIIKIFFENKPVFPSDEMSAELSDFMHHPETVYIDEISSHAINSLLHEIANPEIKRGILFHPNFGEMKRSFSKHFKIVKAAGGVIRNETNEILFIFRKGKWDLPKGKMDDNESPKQCAVREVKEETGLSKVNAGGYICTTFHVYTEFGKKILKETEWFSMQASSKEILTPQLEEGIEKIEWVNNEVNIKLKNSYPLINDVLVSGGVQI
jgi:8-oxo-dGTP pyrophosphatase MutT (NUDIX family)